MLDTREQLHHLVDQLDPAELASARRLLEELRAKSSPAWRASRAAPLDDEPETPEEAAAIAEAWEDIRAGHVIADEELHRKLGIPSPDPRP